MMRGADKRAALLGVGISAPGIISAGALVGVS